MNGLLVAHTHIAGITQPSINGRDAQIMRLMEHNPRQDDGLPFFCVTRGNLFNAGETDLSAPTIQAAIAAIARNGHTARYLIVPPIRHFQATSLITAIYLNGLVDGWLVANPVHDALDVMRNNWLTYDRVTNPSAWAVTASLDTDNPDPGAWVKCVGTWTSPLGDGAIPR